MQEVPGLRLIRSLSRQQRVVYALLAVSTGLPAVMAGGLTSSVLLWFSGLPLLGVGDPRELLLSVLWGGACLAGSIVWSWLSVCCPGPGHGPPGLARVGQHAPLLVAGVAIGALVALPALVAAGVAPAHGSAEGLALLWFGPALLPTSALLWYWHVRRA